ncbi:MAG: hypothetical protein EU541_06960 [Promethearchaeota archaeon]|nr:MAG: hypothetical protein EU541_06960 [Candidatus Lokiarchaeota archaeon]
MERFLWGIGLSILVICAIFYINKGKNNEKFKDKILFYGFSFFFIILALSRFLEFICDFYIIGTFRGFSFYGNYNTVNSLYGFFYKSSEIFFQVSFLLIFLTFEINIKKTKYLITLTQCLLILFTIIFSLTSETFYIFNILVIFTFIYSSTVMLFIFFSFTRTSRLEYKAIGAVLILSAVFFAMAEILAYWEIKQLGIIPLILPPLMYIFGSLIGILPLKSDPERFSNAIWYWDIITAINIIVVILLEIYFIIVKFPLVFIIGLLWYIILIVFLQGYIIKDIQSKAHDTRIIDDQDENLDVLGMFTRPQKVTEEEVSVSKEKKICLICKGKLERSIYICPECNTFYCQNCANTMCNLENACWVCEIPFDESKPVNLPKKHKERIKIEEEETENRKYKKNHKSHKIK